MTALATAVPAARTVPGPGSDAGQLIPAGFCLEEEFGEDRESTPWPGEADLVGPASARNRYQSVMARDCARRGLVRLGHSPASIPRLARGGPAWPDGIVGSLTHCAGYRAAMVGRTSSGRSAGIDAEPHRPLPHGVVELIASGGEQRLLGRLQSTEPDICWDTLLFCVKEAVFKAWFPLTGTWLPMTQATAWLGTDGSFTVSIRLRENQPGDLGLLAWKGRWAVRDGYLVAVTVRAPLA
ncbi:4'-phosphopantetheinyl transferase family protein [Arthrobacter sp. MDT3-24]